MNALLMLVRETAIRAFKIVTLQSVGEDLPQSRGFAVWSAALAVPLFAAEQGIRDHGIVGMILVPAAWLVMVWTASRVDGKIDYRIASALLLGSIPVCVALILVAGHDLWEWVAAAWGALALYNVILKQNKEWSPWR